MVIEVVFVFVMLGVRKVMFEGRLLVWKLFGMVMLYSFIRLIKLV